MLISYDHDFNSLNIKLNNIEQNFLKVIQTLEQKNFAKLRGIVQFTLPPTFHQLNNALTSQTKRNEEITIGIYYDKKRPKEDYRKERIDALINAAKKQDSKLLFFCSKDIDFDHKKIHGVSFKNNEWSEVTSPFPDVINNIFPVSRHRISVPERKLKRLVPFTSFGVGNKFSLPKIMVKHRQFADLLVPFKMVTD